MKYLFFDYDGTLTHNGIISEKNKDALKEAKAQGHKIFLHTGRSKANVPDDAFEIEWDGMICGKGYMEYQGKVLFEHSLSPELLMRALEYCDNRGIRVLWEGVEKVYSNRPNEWLVNVYENLPVRNDLRITAIQIGGSVSKEDAELFPEADVLSFPGYSEVNPKGINKTTALIFLEKEMGVAHEDIIVFGDSENDLDMVKYAHTSVIMHHAPEVMWSYATLRTESDENGVAEGIRAVMNNNM